MADEFAEGKPHTRRRGSQARRENDIDNESGEIGEYLESRRYRQLAEAIGERIRAIRVAQRRSRAHLARAANLADSHLGEIERGEIAPGSSTLAKLAVALRVEVGAIFPDLPALAPLVGLESGPEEEGEARYTPYLESSEHHGYDRGGEQLARLVGQTGSRIPDIEGGERGNERRGEEGRASREVETLLSPAVVAKMAHVEARTLQKWIAQRLVIPSFYVMQEQRSPKQGATSSRGQEAGRSAAFRREDLPGIIEVRNRARVRKRSRTE